MPRNPSISPEAQIEICTLVAATFSVREAARFVGCNESSIRYLKQENPEFAKKLRDAKRAAKSLPRECLRAHASRSVRAAIYLDQRNDPPQRACRSTKPCIDPRRLCKRLYYRILSLIEDPNTRCAVREALRDTYHAAGLKPPARDPELRKKPLPVYPPDGNHWDLQDNTSADEVDRDMAATAAQITAAPLSDSDPVSDSPASICNLQSPPPAAPPNSSISPLTESAPSSICNLQSPSRLLPYQIASAQNRSDDPQFTRLLIDEALKNLPIETLPQRIAARIGDNLNAGRAPLAKGPRRTRDEKKAERQAMKKALHANHRNGQPQPHLVPT